MTDPAHLLSEEDQRKVQASFWGLPPHATWAEIDKQARYEKRIPFYYHHLDWRETMTRLYGIEFPELEATDS